MIRKDYNYVIFEEIPDQNGKSKISETYKATNRAKLVYNSSRISNYFILKVIYA